MILFSGAVGKETKTKFILKYANNMVKFFAAFNIPDLDKKATLTPIRPKEGALNRVSVYIFTVLVELSESRL